MVSLLLVLSSMLLSILVFEVALRIIYPETQFLDSKSDNYWRVWLQTQANQQSNNDKDIIHDRLLGWRMKPLYQRQGVSHNSIGFRGSREFDLFPQRKRILSIGDSFTYGLGVNDDETFSAYLEQIIDAEVINAGVNGYGIDQSLLMWEHNGKQFNPGTVILGYFVDDFFRNLNSIRYGAKPYFTFDKDKQDFLLRGVPVPDFESLMSSEIIETESALRTGQAFSWLLKRFKRYIGIFEYDGLQQQSRLNDYLLDRLKTSVTQTGGQLIVIIIGHCYDGIPEYIMVEDTVMEACHSKNMDCINIAANMRTEDYKSFYGQNCHWSRSGHQYAAKLIADTIIQKEGGSF